MSLLGKKFPVKVVQPMWPFYTAGLVIAYGINSLATTLAATERAHTCPTRTTQLTRDLFSTADEFKNDPRNPSLKTATKPH
ncbi:hypothetical protein Q7P35_008826 [Cladosporium inversicolor]